MPPVAVVMGAQPVPALGPAIARILRQHPTVRLDRVRPSGKNGRILKGDVLAAMDDGSAYANDGDDDGGVRSGAGERPPPAAASQPSSPPRAAKRAAAAPTAPSRSLAAATPPPPAGVPAMDAASGGSRVKYHDEPLSPARRAAAAALLAAKRATPHRYAAASFELDALLALQASLNGRAAAAAGAPPITVTDFCVWAAAAALDAVPEVRATWDAAAARPAASRTADVAFTVHGAAVTPIVWDAGRKGLATIAADVAALADRARAGELQAAEYTGGCFCVSDHSAAGVGAARPVVVAPHAGHLAVGAGGAGSRPAAAGGSGARPVLLATATLSSDARVVSEAAAAEFVATFARVMGDPEGSLM